jgi:hypothetical protein
MPGPARETDEAVAANGHSPAPANPTCAALTTTGRQCRNPATADQPFCGLHTRILREPQETTEPESVAVARAPSEAVAKLGRGADNIELIVRPSRPWPKRSLALAAVTLAVFTLVGALVGYFVANTRTPVYAARAEVTYLLDESIPTDFLRTDRRLATQLVTLRSRSVLAPIAERHGLDVDELRNHVTAEVIESSEVIRIEVRNPDPDLAAAIVDEIVANYSTQVAPENDVAETEPEQRTLATVEHDIASVLLDRRALDQEPDVVGAGTADVDTAARQIELSDRRDAVADEMDDATTETEREALELEARAIDRELIALLGDFTVDLGPNPTVDEIAELRVLDQRLTDLLGERTELLGELDDAESAVITPSVLTPPYVLDEPVEPVPLRSALGGALIGFVVGLMVVLLQRRRWLRDR